MKFEINNDTVLFITDDKTYTLPSEDIARLISRPRTRVLRVVNDKGEVTSMPVSLPIGEIEGFDLLAKAFS